MPGIKPAYTNNGFCTATVLGNIGYFHSRWALVRRSALVTIEASKNYCSVAFLISFRTCTYIYQKVSFSYGTPLAVTMLSLWLSARYTLAIRPNSSMMHSYSTCVQVPTQVLRFSFLGKKILGLVYKCYRNVRICKKYMHIQLYVYYSVFDS